MFNPHQNDPKDAIPCDGRGEGALHDQAIYQMTHCITIFSQTWDTWPVVVGGVEVIPRHLIHPNGTHGLDGRIKALLDVPSNVELVDVENCCVAKVKDEGVAEALRLVIIILVVCKDIVEALKHGECAVEVITDF